MRRSESRPFHRVLGPRHHPPVAPCRSATHTLRSVWHGAFPHAIVQPARSTAAQLLSVSPDLAVRSRRCSGPEPRLLPTLTAQRTCWTRYTYPFSQRWTHRARQGPKPFARFRCRPPIRVGPGSVPLSAPACPSQKLFAHGAMLRSVEPRSEQTAWHSFLRIHWAACALRRAAGPMHALYGTTM